MTTTRVTELAGDKLRKAIEEYCEMKKSNPGSTPAQLMEQICRKFDLSPLEADFLRRQLLENC